MLDVWILILRSYNSRQEAIYGIYSSLWLAEKVKRTLEKRRTSLLGPNYEKSEYIIMEHHVVKENWEEVK